MEVKERSTETHLNRLPGGVVRALGTSDDLSRDLILPSTKHFGPNQIKHSST